MGTMMLFGIIYVYVVVVWCVDFVIAASIFNVDDDLNFLRHAAHLSNQIHR
jgi:hypothetical protein